MFNCWNGCLLLVHLLFRWLSELLSYQLCHVCSPLREPNSTTLTKFVTLYISTWEVNFTTILLWLHPAPHPPSGQCSAVLQADCSQCSWTAVCGTAAPLSARLQDALFLSCLILSPGLCMHPTSDQKVLKIFIELFWTFNKILSSISKEIKKVH